MSAMGEAIVKANVPGSLSEPCLSNWRASLAAGVPPAPPPAGLHPAAAGASRANSFKAWHVRGAMGVAWRRRRSHVGCGMQMSPMLSPCKCCQIAASCHALWWCTAEELRAKRPRHTAPSPLGRPATRLSSIWHLAVCIGCLRARLPARGMRLQPRSTRSSSPPPPASTKRGNDFTRRATAAALGKTTCSCPTHHVMHTRHTCPTSSVSEGHEASSSMGAAVSSAARSDTSG
jgi:hypothetical protein